MGLPASLPLSLGLLLFDAVSDRDCDRLVDTDLEVDRLVDADVETDRVLLADVVDERDSVDDDDVLNVDDTDVVDEYVTDGVGVAVSDVLYDGVTEKVGDGDTVSVPVGDDVTDSEGLHASPNGDPVVSRWSALRTVGQLSHLPRHHHDIASSGTFIEDNGHSE